MLFLSEIFALYIHGIPNTEYPKIHAFPSILENKLKICKYITNLNIKDPRDIFIEMLNIEI